jgi:DNA-binding transcriptional LysR family regulator
VAKEHPLARKARLTAADLREQAIFLTLRQTRTDFYDALMKACRKAGFQPTIRTDLIQLPFIMNVAAAQQGVAFIPQFFHRIRPEGSVFRACTFLPEAARLMPLSLATRKNDASPLVRNFIEAARKTADI